MVPQNPHNPSNPMTAEDPSRVQSGQAKGGGDMSSSGFAARAQAAGAKNENEGKTGQHSQGGKDHAHDQGQHKK